MTTLLRTTAFVALIAAASWAAPSHAKVIIDYGSTGTAFNFNNFFTPFNGGMPDQTVNADSVDLRTTGAGDFGVLVLTGEPTTPIDLSGENPNGFFEIDIEVLPEDESVYNFFRLELQTQNGVDTSVYNFNFDEIRGSVMADGTARVSAAPGQYTLSTEGLHTLSTPGTRSMMPLADLSNINRVELVYQNAFASSRTDTMAIRVTEIRLVPEPSSVALGALGLVGLAARRRRD